MNQLRASCCAIAFAILGIGTTVPALAQTMPTCASGDPVVWENTSTKVYHAQGDSYYGKTKAGAYACKSDADKAGFHLSKSKMKASAGDAGAASSGAAISTGASPAASPMMNGNRRPRRHHMASPAPGAMMSPSAMTSPGTMPSPDAMASPMGKHHRKHKGSAMASPAPSAT